MKDWIDAIEVKEKAMACSEAGAAERWKTAAYVAGVRLCKGQARLTSEDVLAAMPSDVETHDRRALGPLMRRLARDGYCTATGEYRNSGKVKNHHRPQAVWESLTFDSNSLEAMLS